MKDFRHWRHTLFYFDWQYPSASSASALKPLSKWNYPKSMYGSREKGTINKKLLSNKHGKAS